jgi:hypothetical protein
MPKVLALALIVLAVGLLLCEDHLRLALSGTSAQATIIKNEAVHTRRRSRRMVEATYAFKINGQLHSGTFQHSPAAEIAVVEIIEVRFMADDPEMHRAVLDFPGFTLFGSVGAALGIIVAGMAFPDDSAWPPSFRAPSKARGFTSLNDPAILADLTL